MPGSGWRTHANDAPEQGLYIGSAGIVWALRALHARGVTDPPADYANLCHGIGDIGLAWYLVDCIEAKDRFPTLDVFDA